MSSRFITDGGGGGTAPTVRIGPKYGDTPSVVTSTPALTKLAITADIPVTATPAMSKVALSGYNNSLTSTLHGSVLSTPFWQSVATKAGTASTSSVVINKPTGVVSGELLLAFLGADANTFSPDINTPAGWTLINTATISNMHSRSFFRVADGTEATTFTFGLTSTANRTTGEIHRINGIDTTNPINVSAVDTLAAAALVPDPVSPSVTTTVANCMVFSFLFHSHLSLTQTHTAPANNDERTDIESLVGSVFNGSTSDTRVFAAIGATGTATHDCTETVSTDALMHRIAIAPGQVSIG